MLRNHQSQINTASNRTETIEYLIKRRFNNVVPEDVISEALGQPEYPDDPEDPEAVEFAKELLSLRPEVLNERLHHERSIQKQEAAAVKAVELRAAYRKWSKKAY